MFGFLKRKKKDVSTSIENEEETTSLEVIEKFRIEIKNIHIDNQPFRIGGLLHILTNKVSRLLKKNKHKIYYDIENDVGRYIVGDNDYIEQVLEILAKDLLTLSRDSEIILKISKFKNKFLVFEIINENGFIPKKLAKQYMHAERTLTTLPESVNTFIKAKKIAEAMHGNIELHTSKRKGTHFTLQIPFYEDKDSRSNQEELKTFLKGKKALFIGKDKYATQRAQYIFESYGIRLENMELVAFENKKPDLSKYDMAILHSEDLTYKHVSFFKNIYQDKTSDFKIIIVHELFEDEEKIALGKSIAHAELYKPNVIGDVEEILYQMFIMKSKAVKEVSKLSVFDHGAFTIKGASQHTEDNLDRYRGAHIAIAEDSKIDMRVIKNILNIEGVTLFSVQNGADMLELLETEEIDIIFADINMPVMDGLMMTKEIRKIKKWEKLPIISISSMAFSHEVEQMKLAGMNGAIAKPIDAKEVYMALERFLVMTAKMRNRTLDSDRLVFKENKAVLDVEKGLEKLENTEEYKEVLVDNMALLKRTRDAFEKMIFDEEYIALSRYARSTYLVCENMQATQMMQMFEELVEYLGQKQRAHLMDYIYLYHKNWKQLEKEVARYLKSVEIIKY